MYTLRFGFLPGREADKDGTVTVGSGKEREKVPVVSAAAYRTRRQVEISKGRSLRKAMLDKGTIRTH